MTRQYGLTCCSALMGWKNVLLQPVSQELRILSESQSALYEGTVRSVVNGLLFSEVRKRWLLKVARQPC